MNLAASHMLWLGWLACSSAPSPQGFWCTWAETGNRSTLQAVSASRCLEVNMTMSMPNIGWNNQVDSAKAFSASVSVDHLHGEFMKVLDTVEEIKMEKVEAAEEAKRYARERRLREEELRLQAEQGARDSPEKQALLGLPEVAPGDGAAKVRPRKKKGQKKEDVFQDFGKEHDDAPIQEIKKNGLVFYHLNYKRYWQSDRDLERWAKSLGHNIRHEKLLFEVRNRWAEDLLGDRMELKIRHNPLVRSRTQERLRPTTGVSVALQLKGLRLMACSPNVHDSAAALVQVDGCFSSKITAWPGFRCTRHCDTAAGTTLLAPSRRMAHGACPDLWGNLFRPAGHSVNNSYRSQLRSAAWKSRAAFAQIRGSGLCDGWALAACEDSLAFLCCVPSQLYRRLHAVPATSLGKLHPVRQRSQGNWAIVPASSSGDAGRSSMSSARVDADRGSLIGAGRGSVSDGMHFCCFRIDPAKFLEDDGKDLARGCQGGKCSGLLSLCCCDLAIPKVLHVLQVVLQLPPLIWLYEAIVFPSWQILSPLFLPVATGSIAFASFRSLVTLLNPDPAPVDAARMLGQFFCGCSAALSSCCLILNYAYRIWPRREQPDPLRRPWLLKALMYPAGLVAVPVRAVRILWRLFMNRLLRPVLVVFMDCIGHLLQFAVKCPIVSIPAVICFNVVLIRSTSTSGTILYVLAQSSPWASKLLRSLAKFQALVAEGATDSTFALALIGVVQATSFAIIDGILSVLRVIRSPSTGQVLSLEELNEVAAAMEDPRQCGRCGFGPVDHRGCSDLSAHHGEVSIPGGAAISNRCPRCGWFVSVLSEWPEWDGELRTEQGRALYRQRAWCEIVVCVRAASKALVVPYAMLLLGNQLGSPTLTAMLVLSYLAPWAYENASLCESLTASQVYAQHPERRRPSRRQTPSPGAAECGAARRAPQLPDISEEEALRNILSAIPMCIFLKQGDVCSVCLETFPAEAADIVMKSDTTEAACRALRALEPPILALRCGHPLHLECAMAAVTASSERHVRCPLCQGRGHSLPCPSHMLQSSPLLKARDLQKQLAPKDHKKKRVMAALAHKPGGMFGQFFGGDDSQAVDDVGEPLGSRGDGQGWDEAGSPSAARSEAGDLPDRQSISACSSRMGMSAGKLISQNSQTLELQELGDCDLPEDDDPFPTCSVAMASTVQIGHIVKAIRQTHDWLPRHCNQNWVPRNGECCGYLCLEVDELATVSYVGHDDDENERGWLFGSHNDCQGWLHTDAVVPLTFPDPPDEDRLRRAGLKMASLLRYDSPVAKGEGGWASVDEVKMAMRYPELLEHVVARSINKDGIARFELNETRQLIRATPGSARTLPNTAVANVATYLRDCRTLERFACTSTVAKRQTIPILTCSGCGKARRTYALTCGHKLCESCALSSCPFCLKKHYGDECSEIQSNSDPRSSQPGRSSSSEFHWRSEFIVWHIRPRETRKHPFDDPSIDRVENIFAADIPAASTTSAHILRFWKIEQSRNEFTAQVYFLQGNVSFDPIREEYVKAAAIMFSAPSPPHRSVSDALRFVCNRGHQGLFHRPSGGS
eukprot:s923_g14.t4